MSDTQECQECMFQPVVPRHGVFSLLDVFLQEIKKASCLIQRLAASFKPKEVGYIEKKICIKLQNTVFFL